MPRGRPPLHSGGGMRRNSKAERDQWLADVRARDWPGFEQQLRGLQTFSDASAFWAKRPDADHPTREFFDQLGDVLGGLKAPSGANRVQLSAYLSLVERFARNDSRAKLIANLKNRMFEIGS
jgi:hypothetical protein